MTRVVLLTGGTGHVGGELARRLADSGDVDRVIALVRTASPRTTDPRAERVHGDVTQPDLGLDPAVARHLAWDVTDVVHAAADTRFLAAPGEVARTNVVGTERVLDFAARCPRLRKLTHVSTLYAVGLTPGRILEERSTARDFANEYQRSKCEAEEAVLARRMRLPAAIVRSSTWLGDSRDGSTTHPNFVHSLIRLLACPLAPIAHVDPDARLDALATDWAADALVALHLHAPEGGVFHLAAGDDATRVGTAIEDVERAYRNAGFEGYRIPRIVDAETFTRFLEDVRHRGPRLLAGVLDRLETFLPHFRVRQTFDDRRARAVLEGRLVPRPPLAETLRLVLRWYVATPAAGNARQATG